MSIKVMAAVWDGFPYTGSELLAMLALADWCDDRGGSLFPSVRAVGEKIRLGEKQTRRILRTFEQDRFLAVVGNHGGGKPGATREYRLNIVKLKELASAANAKREAENAARHAAKNSDDDQWNDIFDTPPAQGGPAKNKETTPPPQGSPTPPPQGSPTPPPQGSPTPPAQDPDPSLARGVTPPAHGSLTTIEPPAEPPSITAGLAAQPSAEEFAPAKQEVEGAVVVIEKPRPPMVITAPNGTVYSIPGELKYPGAGTKTHKAWLAYAIAYQQRYNAWPTWNATVAGQMAKFIGRVGEDAAPRVAVHYVRRVNEEFVVRQMHPVKQLLSDAEKWATQQQTGASMTNTRARQADQTEANCSAADEAIALMRARRQAKGAANAE